MSKDIINYNSKGQPHGYMVWYYSDGKLWYKCLYDNGDPIGYCEFYDYYSWELDKRFYI